MSHAATLERPVFELFRPAEAEHHAVQRDWIELDPPIRFSSQASMRFGPRSYTPQQAAFIEHAVPTALPEPPLPLAG
ncbi:MAG: hypothetical protein WBV77_01485 [Solirubrobacteraceae bacterium]